MLNLLRENLKSLSWVLWLVIIVFVGLVFFELPRQGNQGGPRDAAVWAADGEFEVTYAEYKRTYQQTLNQYRQILGDQITPEQTTLFGNQALRQVVNAKIMAQEARRVGLSVSDEEVQQFILDIPWMKDENGRFIGAERYRRVVRSLDFLDTDDFESSVRDSLLNEKLSEALLASVYVSPEEVEQAYRDQVERAKVRYVQLPGTAFTNDVQVAQEDLEAHYEAHKAEYTLPEQRVVSYLLVDNVLLRNTLEVTEEDIQNYYNANTDQFRQEEQVRARHILLRTDSRTEEEARQEMQAIRSQIEGGRDFAEMAREASEDPGSGARGGDLGLFARGRMVPEFEEAAFNASLNELVGPITSPFGVHLLEVTERRQAGLQPLDEVSPRLRQIVISERLASVSEQRAQDVLAQLKDADGASPEERFEQIADSVDYATRNVTEAFSEGDLVPGIGRSEEFVSAAFALEDGATSDPVKVPRGWAILSLKSIEAPRLQELTEVEAPVRQAVRVVKQQEMAGTRLHQAREEISGGKTLDTVAEELGLTVQESNEFGRTGGVAGLGEASTEVIERAMALNAGDFGPVVEDSQGAVLFEVTERTSYDATEFESRKTEIEDGVKQQKLGRLIASLVEKRQRELNIQYAKDLAESLNLGLSPAG